MVIPQTTTFVRLLTLNVLYDNVMLIKYPALNQALKKQSYAIYVLLGDALFYLNAATDLIKSHWKQTAESDYKLITIGSHSDWHSLVDEANHYSLFADRTLLDVRYDKKTLDSEGKNTLLQYLSATNPRCLILLRLSAVQPKQVSWLTNHNQVLATHVSSPNAAAMQTWITEQLHTQQIRFDPSIPQIIQQYTQGNMLACAQVIERLSLTYDSNTILSPTILLAQLQEQNEYLLYELTDACLQANMHQAIRVLHYAQQQKTEPTLILWLLTQEIRTLINLVHQHRQSNSWSAACQKLNIWSSKVRAYETSCTRLPLAYLYQLLQFAQQLDEQIKTNTHPIWESFEKLILHFCHQTPFATAI